MQFIFSLRSLSSDDTSFIIYYALTISSIAIICQATMPYSEYEEFPTFIAYILDIFAQLFIFAILYITTGSIAFYGCTLMKLLLMFVIKQKYPYHSNTCIFSNTLHQMIPMLSIYQSGQWDITDSLPLFATILFGKLVIASQQQLHESLTSKQQMLYFPHAYNINYIMDNCHFVPIIMCLQEGKFNLGRC